MKKQISLIFATFFIGIIAFFALNMRFVDIYNPDVSEQKISQNFFTKSYYADFDKKQNAFYIGFDKNLFYNNTLSLDDEICVEWRANDDKYRECLDVEHSDETGEFYTFPAITDAREKIAFDIFVNDKKLQKNIDVTLYSINTLPEGKKLAFVAPNTDAAMNVISRANWGADESIRYTDHPRQIAAYKKNLEYLARPKTEAELKAIENTNAINNFINTQNAGLFTTKSLIRTENWHRLVWPIQRVNRVNKIVVHHTADSLDKNRSDEEIIRAIYSYHAITRGWGDIGYNYLIGQTGKVYEGRAGGDYTVGAHASYNNLGSVGISVLGDYEKNPLNNLQEISLKNTIDELAQKYGIRLTDTVKWYKKCTTKNCWPLQVVNTPALLGHKDVGQTNCPGKHIYSKLGLWRVELSKNLTPVLNTENGFIEPKPANETNNLTPKNSITSDLFANSSAPINPDSEETAPVPTNLQNINAPKIQNITNIEQKSITPSNAAIETDTKILAKNPETPVTTRYFGKKMRVKLSYPHETISLSSYGDAIANAYLDYSRKPIYPGNDITISAVGNDQIFVKIGNFTYTLKNFSFSAGVVKIDSWTRIPAWDKNSQYNDNLFRDTIEVFNENGKIVVVNHLPLEWYLKGLGEVSNTDLPEKIKTITVAARGYASFYMDSKNRKYNTNRYDGSDNPDSFQNYLGYSYELRSPNVAKIVDATAGEIIYYKNEAIKPWYFSSSDGKTLSHLEYCQKNSGKNCEDIPYLQSVEDVGGIGKTRSGHGVGISGIGATHLASQWWDYKKIITYYLTGTEVRK